MKTTRGDLQRRQSVAAVGACVFLVADPDQRRLQQRHDRRQDLPLVEAPAPHVASDALPELRQRLREGQHFDEFRFAPRLLPVRMIAILFDDGARRQDVRKTLAVDLERYAGIIVIDVR